MINKVDFVLFVTVNKANPNGDPLTGNRPRENYEGFGEISDVCIKRKIRNRFQDMGDKIFVQSDERCDDGYKSLSDRAKGCEELQRALKLKDKEEYVKAACQQWIDVRTFGQVFAFKDDSVSVGVRGPVSLHPGVSLSPVNISSMQITKSVNSETKEKKSSDTMGMKHRIDFAVYMIKGSINVQLAEKTGFNETDLHKVKEALLTLFENDCSSARPEGSMEVRKLYWWQHSCKAGQYSSAKVHNSIKIEILEKEPQKFEDYKIEIEPLENLTPEILEGK